MWLALALFSVASIGTAIAPSFQLALLGRVTPVFQIRLLRTAKPGTEATAGAIGITVVNLGIAAGAALGGLTVRVLDVGSLPVVAAVVIATSAAAQVFSDVRASGR